MFHRNVRDQQPTEIDVIPSKELGVAVMGPPGGVPEGIGVIVTTVCKHQCCFIIRDRATALGVVADIVEFADLLWPDPAARKEGA